MSSGNQKLYKDQVLECETLLVGAGVTASKFTSRQRPIVTDAATVALTAAQSGALVIFAKVDGVTVTLPSIAAPAVTDVPPSMVGTWYDFLVDTASTSVGQKVITNVTASQFIRGNITQLISATPAFTKNAANGTTHVSVNLNGTTTGGIQGSFFRLTCVSATIWQVDGLVYASGSLATPFATS